MLVALATILIAFAGLLILIAAPLTGAFGEQLRGYAGKAVATAILFIVAGSVFAQTSWLTRLLIIVAACLIAFIVAELRMRLSLSHHRSTPTFTNYRRSGKVPVGDEPAENSPGLLEHEDEDRQW